MVDVHTSSDNVKKKEGLRLKNQTIQKLCFREHSWLLALRIVDLQIRYFSVSASTVPICNRLLDRRETTLNPSLHLKAAFKIRAGNRLKIYNTRTLRPGIVWRRSPIETEYIKIHASPCCRLVVNRNCSFELLKREGRLKKKRELTKYQNRHWRSRAESQISTLFLKILSNEEKKQPQKLLHMLGK